MSTRITLLIAALMMVASGVLAQNATIKGNVKYEGEIAVGASVALLQNNSLVKGQYTDENGNYRFQGLDAGDYQIIASYSGNSDTIAVGGLGSSETRPARAIDIGTLSTEVIEVGGEPLVKQDEVTTGTNFSADDIKNGAIGRGIEGVVSQTAKVVTDPNGGQNIGGSRSNATEVYVDGMRVYSQNLPQSAMQNVEVITGGTPPWYGDVTSGVINITTKRPSSVHSFGGEAVTSEFLDGYGYNLAALNATGPILMKKDSAGNKQRPIMGYFVAGEFQYERVDRPVFGGVPVLKDGVLEDLQETPLQLAADGNQFQNRAYFVDDNDMTTTKENPNNTRWSGRVNGRIDILPTDDIQLRVGGFFSRDQSNGFSLRNVMYAPGANQERITNQYRGYVRFQQTFTGEEGSLFKSMFYSLQAEYSRQEQESFDSRHGSNLFDYGHVGTFNNNRAEIYSIVTPNDPNFNNEIGVPYWQTAGYIDTAFSFDPSSSRNPIVANYNRAIYDYYSNNPRSLSQSLGVSSSQFPPFSTDDAFTTNVVNSQDLLNSGGVINGFNDPNLSSEMNIYSLFTGQGTISNSYVQRQNERFRATAQATITLGRETRTKNNIHNIKVGFEFQQDVNRLWYVSPTNLWIYARNQTNRHLANLDTSQANIFYEPFNNTFLAHANPLYAADDQSTFDRNLRESLGLPVDGTEFINVDGLDPDQLDLGMFSADEVYNNSTAGFGYYGYDYTGDIAESSNSNFFDDPENRPQDAFRPTYIAGYIHDKFELDRIFLSLGLRVDRYDANQQVLQDKFSLVPLYNAGETSELLGSELPRGVGNDWVAYVDDALNPTTVLGYRDGDQWFDANGAPVAPQRLQVNGQVQPHIQEDSTSINSFEDYTPALNFLPRISFSFPITDKANFYAHYDVLTQRPPSASFLFYGQYAFLEQNATRSINNPALQPERTVDYAVGFNQVLNEEGSLALGIEAYYREMRDMIQIVRNQNAYPITYDSYENLDFATVKGFSLNLQTRRLGIFKGNISYTLQFAEGTGSSFTSSRAALGGVEGFSTIRTLLPLTFDQRQTIAGNIDLRWVPDRMGNKRGPRIGNVYPLNNFGISTTFNVASGRPFTRSSIPNQADVQFGVNSTSQVQGNPLGSRLPWTYTVDLRVDRDFVFKLGKKDDNSKYDSRRALRLNVYAVVLNLFNVRNIVGIYQYTGLPDQSGFLETGVGESVLESEIDREAFTDQYRAAERLGGSTGIPFGPPRRIRLGVMFSF